MCYSCSHVTAINGIKLTMCGNKFHTISHIGTIKQTSHKSRERKHPDKMRSILQLFLHSSLRYSLDLPIKYSFKDPKFLRFLHNSNKNLTPFAGIAARSNKQSSSTALIQVSSVGDTVNNDP